MTGKASAGSSINILREFKFPHTAKISFGTAIYLYKLDIGVQGFKGLEVPFWLCLLGFHSPKAPDPLTKALLHQPHNSLGKKYSSV